MSATTDWARKQQCNGDPFAKLVLLTLSFYCNWETGETYVSADTIKDQCEASERTVRRKLQELVQLGLISIDQRPGRSSVIKLLGYQEWHQALPVKKHTPVTVSGVSERHPGQSDRTPLSQSPDTPVRVTPDLITYHTNLSNSFKKGLDSDATLGSEETRVWFHNDEIKLCDSLNQFWLAQFDNQSGDLALALLQVAAYVQPNSKFQNLEKQVSAQLSKIVRERREKDRRYSQAKNANTKTVTVENKSSRGWVKVQQGSDLFNAWLDVAKEHGKSGLISIFAKNGTLIVPPGAPQEVWHEFLAQTSQGAA